MVIDFSFLRFPSSKDWRWVGSIVLEMIVIQSKGKIRIGRYIVIIMYHRTLPLRQARSLSDNNKQKKRNGNK